MKSSVNPRFLKALASLPAEVQRNARKAYRLWKGGRWRRHPRRTSERNARKAYRLWKDNPRHPSLHFKKTGKVWSVRVDEAHRALGHLLGDTMHWFWIGGHDDYEELIRNAPKTPHPGPRNPAK